MVKNIHINCNNYIITEILKRKERKHVEIEYKTKVEDSLIHQQTII